MTPATATSVRDAVVSSVAAVVIGGVLMAICWIVGDTMSDNRELKERKEIREYDLRAEVVKQCGNVDSPTRCVADIIEALEALEAA